MPGSLSRSSPPSAPPPSQVREVIIDSVADYRATERAEWVLKWPGACLIAVSGIFWTAEVEEALTAKGNAGETRRRPPRPMVTWRSVGRQRRGGRARRPRPERRQAEGSR